jgi:hypothetical protein
MINAMNDESKTGDVARSNRLLIEGQQSAVPIKNPTNVIHPVVLSNRPKAPEL